jgi:hypothetical protein
MRGLMWQRRFGRDEDCPNWICSSAPISRAPLPEALALYMLDFLKCRIAVNTLGAYIQVSSNIFPLRLEGK